jgi:hypothetical protein
MDSRLRLLQRLPSPLPEAIELVYLPQLEALRGGLETAAESGVVSALDEPGWFWHDFPDWRWADSVRRLPSEDPSRFEEEMREAGAALGENCRRASFASMEGRSTAVPDPSLPA